MKEENMIKLSEIAKEFYADPSNFYKWMKRNLPQVCLKQEHPQGVTCWMVHEKDLPLIRKTREEAGCTPNGRKREKKPYKIIKLSLEEVDCLKSIYKRL
jgi:hypothetical protein